MRRIGLILLLAASVAALLTTSATGDDEHTYYIEMDNAFGLVNGSEVKVAGVEAGTIPDLFINSEKRAVAKVALADAWNSPAADALYFNAVRRAPGRAIRVASIGNHIFYR